MIGTLTPTTNFSKKTTIIQQRPLVRYHSMQVEEEQQRKATYNLTNLVNELLQLV